MKHPHCHSFYEHTSLSVCFPWRRNVLNYPQLNHPNQVFSIIYFPHSHTQDDHQKVRNRTFSSLYTAKVAFKNSAEAINSLRDPWVAGIRVYDFRGEDMREREPEPSYQS